VDEVIAAAAIHLDRSDLKEIEAGGELVH